MGQITPISNESIHILNINTGNEIKNYKNPSNNVNKDDTTEEGCDDPVFNKSQDTITLNNENMDIKLHYKITNDRIKFNIEAQNKTFKNLKGGVSISFPMLDSAYIHSSNGGFNSLKVYPAGSKIWNRDLKRAVRAKYLLVEAWSNKWSAKAIKRASFEMDIKNLIYLKTQIRGVLINGRREMLTPSFYNGIKDQQGYSVKKVSINITNSNSSNFNYNSSNISSNGLIDTYYAKISQKDKYSSSGRKLTKIYDILQQDRANYHKFYKRDKEDTYDSFFITREHRNRMKYMLLNGNISYKTKKSILYSTPLLRVNVYKNHINIEMINKKYTYSKDLVKYKKQYYFPYVCYRSKSINKTNIKYNSCLLSKKSCKIKGLKHFGKYQNKYESLQAFKRCLKSKPRFID